MPRSILFLIREFFFPSGCGLCGTALDDPEEAWQGLCGPCGEAVEVPPQGETCSRCGRPLVSEIGRCTACREREDWYCDSLSLLYPYTGKYRRILGAYKFGKNLGVGNFLARRLGERCRNYPDFELVPVPPRPGKLRRQGWDQVEYLARRLEKEGFPVRRCLKRTDLRAQKKLARRERLENLEGRFISTAAAPRKALLIDDVITTGATLESCAAALKGAGAEQVCGVCLFYD
jgi:ComF family protein